MTDFETLYRRNPDPWDTRASWYECRKREILLASLPRESYGRTLELGCGTGELTLRLAQRSDALCAVDLSPTAIERCRAHLAQSGLHHAQTLVMRVPHAWPAGAAGYFDLIVVSELAYYLEDAEVELFFSRCSDSLATQGDWVMCHYLPSFHDRLQDTASLHESLSRHEGLAHRVSHRDERFQLDIWRKRERKAP